MRVSRVTFAALDTYSLVGGLQNFNRRVIRSLSALGARPNIHLMRDTPKDLPPGMDAKIMGHGACHLCFVKGVLQSVRSADVLLLGHINILPVGVLAKVFNPRLKLVLFVHGDEVWNDPIYRRMRWYEPFLVRSLAHIASVSDYTANVMAREFGVPRDRFVVFPNAVDPLPQPPGGPSETETILVVTRLAAHDGKKHVDSVIRAFAAISARRPNARLDVIGDGVLRASLEELAHSLSVSERVTFHGRVSDDELAAAYARARLFVMPSNKEGFGIVFLEAWLRGLPVICGSEGASREIISDGIDGFVADPMDIACLAEKIELLLSDRERAIEMGAAGRMKVLSHYLHGNFELRLREVLLSTHGSEAR